MKLAKYKFLIILLLKNIHYKWIQVGFIETNSDIVCISWNNDGNRLLVGCSIGTIQLWSYNSNTDNSSDSNATNQTTTASNGPVKFSICEEESLEQTNSINIQSNKSTEFTKKQHQQTKHEIDESILKVQPIFKKIWEKRLSSAVKCIKFSPDGSLFATYGEV